MESVSEVMKTLSVRVPEEMLRALKVRVASEGGTLESTIGGLIRTFLDGEGERIVGSSFPPPEKIRRSAAPRVANGSPGVRLCEGCGHGKRWHENGRCAGACLCREFV